MQYVTVAAVTRHDNDSHVGRAEVAGEPFRRLLTMKAVRYYQRTC